MKEEHVRIVQGSVALTSGSLIVVSLFIPWVAAYTFEAEFYGEVNAFQLGETIATHLRMEIVKTLFNFLLLFGALVIIGGILIIADFAPGSWLTRIGSILTVVFASIAVLLISVIPFLSPGLAPWLCVGSGIMGAISPRIKPR